jgi:hypothetical protein
MIQVETFTDIDVNSKSHLRLAICSSQEILLSFLIRSQQIFPRINTKDGVYRRTCCDIPWCGMLGSFRVKSAASPSTPSACPFTPGQNEMFTLLPDDNLTN